MENLFGTRYSGRKYTYPILLKYTYPIIITTQNSHTINGEEPENMLIQNILNKILSHFKAYDLGYHVQKVR